jgi:hypothetical protein
MNAGWILAAFLPPDRRDELLADLEEEFQALAQTAGIGAARRWYASQIGRSLPPVIGRWAYVRVAMAARSARPPSVGLGFTALALLWWLAVACVIPFDSEGPAMRSPDARQAGAVTLQDGSARLVYWLGQPAPAQRPRTSGLMRLSVIVLAPPAGVALGLIAVLATLEEYRAARRRILNSSWRS